MKRAVELMLLALAVLCLMLGLVLPIIELERLYFFVEAPSIFDLVAALWQSGDVALCLLVGLFSVVFPIVKLGALGLEILVGEAGPKLLRRVMPHLSKWSMMDVMLVAIVIFAAKNSGLAVAVAEPGLWFYAGSTMISGLLSSYLTTTHRS